MRFDIKLSRQETEEILKEVIALKYKLQADIFSFNFDLIDDRTGMQGFTGVTISCKGDFKNNKNISASDLI